MNIVMHSDTSITLRNFDQPDFDVKSEDAEAHFSALPMFAASLGLCTFSVIAEYAQRFDAPVENIEVDVDWEYVEDPFRIGSIDMVIRWPEVPEERLGAVERAAGQCTIHNTLHHPPEMTTSVEAG